MLVSIPKDTPVLVRSKKDAVWRQSEMRRDLTVEVREEKGAAAIGLFRDFEVAFLMDDTKPVNVSPGMPCPHCGGTGYHPKGKCYRCRGNGRLNKRCLEIAQERGFM